MRVQRSIAGILTTILLLGATGWLVPGVKAETTAPLKHVYNGHLLDSSGNAITTAHKVRFSYWTSADYVSGDVTATGAINTGASAYASWNEVFTVTPDSRGYFSVQLGSGTALPVISSQSANTLKNLHLQVEVKSGAAADTSYEVLDRDANDPTVDRSPVLSVPSALNADMIDRRDVGTGSGSIPVLGSGGLLETTQIPAGTSQDRFTIDNDSSAADTVTLRFGQSINQTLTFDVASDRFDFNDDLRVRKPDGDGSRKRCGHRKPYECVPDPSARHIRSGRRTSILLRAVIASTASRPIMPESAARPWQITRRITSS